MRFVAFWPLADIKFGAINVCFQGQGRHCDFRCEMAANDPKRKSGLNNVRASVMVPVATAAPMTTVPVVPTTVPIPTAPADRSTPAITDTCTVATPVPTGALPAIGIPTIASSAVIVLRLLNLTKLAGSSAKLA